MTRRASWRGQLKFGDFICEVGLFSALTSTDKISFNIVNAKTGNRVERQYIDSDTGNPVDKDDQVKGYALENGEHLIIEGDELAQLLPDNDKVIRITRFLAFDEIDKLYFDRPYYLSPSAEGDDQALALLARSLKEQGVAALAEAVLFRRNRILLIRPQADTLVATTLNYDYEVRAQSSVFKGIADVSFDEEMLELAGHIIAKRSGTFNPADYTDRYNDALGDLVKAKIEGRPIEKRAPEKRDNVIDLREALRESAGSDASKKKSTAPKKTATTRAKKKAG
jgi:DNA end-binding protein Ku